MNKLFFARIFAYTILPLLLAAGHLLLDRQARTPARRIELFMLYLFAIRVGANGIGMGFGTGYATGALFLWTQAAVLIGVGAGILLRNRAAGQPVVTAGQRRS